MSKYAYMFLCLYYIIVNSFSCVSSCPLSLKSCPGHCGCGVVTVPVVPKVPLPGTEKTRLTYCIYNKDIQIFLKKTRRRN